MPAKSAPTKSKSNKSNMSKSGPSKSSLPKPRAKAVGGSRKSAGWVDESETGSANETASLGRLFHFQAALPTGPGL